MNRRGIHLRKNGVLGKIIAVACVTAKVKLKITKRFNDIMKEKIAHKPSKYVTILSAQIH